MSDEMTLEKRAAGRWGVHSRTVLKWVALGEKSGEAPPLLEGDPFDLLEWYRATVGREASAKLKAKAEALRRELGLADAGEVPIDLGPVEVIKKALARLGLSLSLARVIEEEERAHAAYEAARDAGHGVDAARRRWAEAGEMKRALQKSSDAVTVSLELLREWVLMEWEVEERAVRARLVGAVMGRDLRERLLETKGEKEWERVWDAGLERALSGDAQAEASNPKSNAEVTSSPTES